MPCTRPTLSYRSPSETSHSVTTKTQFGEDLGYELTSWGCGKCPDCKAAKARDWGIRIGHHCQRLLELGQDSAYVTLTYAPEHLPEDQGLEPSHITKTFKTLRNQGKSFKYFQCGEYGEEFLRPHHHCIFMGEAFAGDRKLARVRSGRPIWTSPSLAEAWPYGNHEIETVNFAAGCYVAGYTAKKLHNQPVERTDPTTGDVWSVLPAYVTMSKGIGTSWFEKYWADVYPHDFVVIDGDRTSRPPQWYDRLYSQKDPAGWADIQASRRAFSAEHSHSWQMLRNREFVSQRKQDGKVREPDDS